MTDVSEGSHDPPVRLTRKAEAPVLTPPSTGWPYLDTPAFHLRGVIAAHFVRRCPQVIEIGGGPTSIEHFLGGSLAEVIVLDPFVADRTIQARAGGAIRHLRARFQDVAWEVRRPREYGLVMLGLELLDMGEDDYRRLFALIEEAQVTVLEFSSTFATPRGQFAMIRERTATVETFTCKLDLRGNEVPHSDTSWPVHFEREVHVLEPRP